jgi:CBS domain-containing protein
MAIEADATVGDLMTPAPFTINPGDLVGDTRDTMLEAGIHCVPVVDDDGTPVGIVTSWDLVEEYAPMESIQNAMTTKVRTIGSHELVSEAATTMCTNFIHHLVVVDRSNHLVGVLSSLDLLGQLIDA